MRPRPLVATVMVIVSVVLFVIHCQGEKELAVKCFPAQIGNWWDHEYRFLIIVYDTVANDTSKNLYVDSLHDEIISTDTLDGWSCYRFHETSYDNTRWYAHPDSALLYIAALTNEAPQYADEFAADVSYVLHGIIFQTTGDLVTYTRNLFSGLPWNCEADTVYLTPPQKVYVYPMSIGTSWISMTDPWYEEREVVAAESVTVMAGDFQALKIRVSIEMGIDDARYIWITEDGMLKDSIYSRGIAFNAVGDTFGYFDVYMKFELMAYEVE